MLTQLSLAQMAHVADGKLAAAVATHLRKVTDDCQDRPGSDAARRVTIDLYITPSVDPETGQCDDVNIEFEVGSKVPKHRTKPVNMKIRKSTQGPQLLFNDLSQDNADQHTLDKDAPNFLPANEDHEG